MPALIREGDDDLEVALIENLQREDLSPLEEAEALAVLIERHSYSHREVADLLGKSRPYVSNTLALNKLPDAVKAELHRDGRNISREILMGIARQEAPEAAEALWRRLQLDAVSVRKFRAEQNGKVRGGRPARRLPRGPPAQPYAPSPGQAVGWPDRAAARSGPGATALRTADSAAAEGPRKQPG